MFADYECQNEKCKEITVFRKKYGKDFPKTVKCEKCKGKAKRQYSKFTMSVGGFDSLGIYHPAALSPMNKVFVGGRIAGVESEDSNY